MASRTVQIDNMHCGACVRRVTMALNKIPGTTVADVQIGAARISTEADSDTILQALSKAGYPAHAE